MIVDNTEQIKKLISGCDREAGEFYTLHIFYRCKDGSSPYVSKDKPIGRTYYVSSPEYLDRKMPEIKAMCNLFNARAYINLNKKSWKQVSLKSLGILAQSLYNENYSKLMSLVDSACGETGACDKNKTWVLDVDTKDEKELTLVKGIIDMCEPFDTEKVVDVDTKVKSELEEVMSCVRNAPSNYDDNVIDVLETLHGYHILSHPFNLLSFHKCYTKPIDIHKNAPTLLYYNEKE